MKIPDQIRFIDGPAENYMVGWNGDWPPPDQLVVAVGKETGMITVIGEIDSAQAFELYQVANVMTYCLRNASRLPDDFESEIVFRGAEYIFDSEAE